MHALLSFVVFIVGLFVLFVFLLGKGKILPFKILAVQIAILLSILLFGILLKTKLLYSYPHFFRVNAPFGYLLGPIHFFFIRSILLSETRFRKWDFIHLLPFVLHVVELIPFYNSSANDKLQLLQAVENNNVINFIELEEGLLKSQWHSALKFLSYFFYLLYSFKMYRDFKVNALESIKIENQRLLDFVNHFLNIKTLGFLLMILALILHRVSPTISFFCLDLSTTVVLVLILYILVKNPDLLYGMQYSFAYKNDLFSLQKNYLFSNKLIQGYENSPYESSLFIDLDFKITYFNKTFEEKIKIGFCKQLKVGDDIKSFLTLKSAPLFFKGYNLALEGKPYKIESFISISDLVNESWWEFCFNPIKDDNGKIIGVFLTTKDIQEQKKLEQLIVNYQEQLKDIAWRESHLVRAPVSNLLGLSNLLLKPDSALDIKEKTQLIRHINSEVERLDKVIHQIVATSSDLSSKNNF